MPNLYDYLGVVSALHQGAFHKAVENFWQSNVGQWINEQMGSIDKMRQENDARALAASASAIQRLSPNTSPEDANAMAGKMMMAFEQSQNALGPVGFTGIVSPEKARTLATKLNIPKDDIFHQAIQNTPGASIVEDGILMKVARSQKPEQALTESVRGGVFYLPEGSDRMKFYSTGRNGYGGSEKIAGETLIKNPILVKGATGGKAPQMAFDQLKGKGAYEAMRSEALKSVSGWNMNYSEKLGKVQEFLDQFAPELSDYAEHILENSKTGNQLPYALQEAAVSSAVRNAGHDAVLGYSLTRQKQPFISEIFDVRESHYPNKFGDSIVWDKFEK